LVVNLEASRTLASTRCPAKLATPSTYASTPTTAANRAYQSAFTRARMLPSPLAAPPDSPEREGRCRCHIQRVDVVIHRNRDRSRCRGECPATEPLPLGTEHKCEPLRWIHTKMCEILSPLIKRERDEFETRLANHG